MLGIFLFLFGVVAVVTYKWLTGVSLRRWVMRRVTPMICHIRPHRRSLQTVRLAGDVYRSTCRRCGAPIQRIGKAGKWAAIVADEPRGVTDSEQLS